MNVLDERFNRLEQKITGHAFRENKRLGNEVGYYIFDYPANEELYVRERIEYLKRKSDNHGFDFTIAVFDLYDIMIDVLESRGYMEKCYDMERKRGFQKVSTAVANLLKVNSTEGFLVEYVKAHTLENSVIFITGIGKCYPIIRSHTVLNNLHQVIDFAPVILFYPGKYSGQELTLFGEIKDDNYYRAFKIVE